MPDEVIGRQRSWFQMRFLMRDRISVFLKIAAINLLLLMAGIFALELIFGNWLGKVSTSSQRLFRRNLKMKSHVQGLYETTLDTIVYTRDWFGLRGTSTFNKPEEIYFLTVGGSTTDQKLINDDRTWQEVLERRFMEGGRTVRISNAGFDGQSTSAHIENFDNWFRWIPRLKPRYILFYIGINDIYSAHIKEKEAHFLSKWPGKKRVFVDRSGLYDLYKKIRGTYAATSANVSHSKKGFDSAGLIYTDSVLLDPSEHELFEKKFVPDFKERVRKLIDLTLAMGAEPIFATQSTIRAVFRDGVVVGIDGPFRLPGSQYDMNGLGFHKVSLLYAEAIRDVCAGRYKVVDLTANPILHRSDYYDYHHHSESGAEKLGNELYRQLREVVK